MTSHSRDDSIYSNPAKVIALTTMLLLLTTTPSWADTELSDILYAVGIVESNGRDIGLHPDGVTYGRYGITYMAVNELHRVGWISTRRVNLRNPATNRTIAVLYLRYLKKRYGSWWSAVKHYNPRSNHYARKIWAEMDRRDQKRN